jgi:hypothetical protein
MFIRLSLSLFLLFSAVLAIAQPRQYIVADSMFDASVAYIVRFQQQPLKIPMGPPIPGGDSLFISAYPDKPMSKDFYTEKLSLFISDTTESKAYWKRMNGLFPVYIINASSKPRELIAEEGSIIMIQEAKDEKGNWRPIEYWQIKDPYIKARHLKTLEPGSMLEVGVPRYQGDYKTTLRMRVLLNKAGRCLYSNQYEGSIMRSQLLPPIPGQRNLYYLDKALF